MIVLLKRQARLLAQDKRRKDKVQMVYMLAQQYHYDTYAAVRWARLLADVDAMAANREKELPHVEQSGLKRGLRQSQIFRSGGHRKL